MKKTTYKESDIQVIPLTEAIRKRPGMYIGNTGPVGLSSMLCELAFSCADDLHAQEIRIHVFRNKSIDMHIMRAQCPPKLLQRTLAGKITSPGGNFDLAFMVFPALAESFRLRVNGKSYSVSQKFRSTPALALKSGKSITALRFSFVPDKKILGTTGPDPFRLNERLNEIALVCPGLKIILRDERTSPFSQNVWHYPAGIKHLLDSQAARCIGRDFENFIEFDENGIRGQAGWFYNNSYGQPPMAYGFANGICSVHGGSHANGLIKGIQAGIKKAIAGDPKEYDLSLNRVVNNLCFVVSVWGAEFGYHGNTRMCLDHKPTELLLKKLVAAQISTFCTNDPEKGKEFVERFRKYWPFHNIPEQLAALKKKK